MDTESSHEHSVAARRVVVLLAAAVFINYFDRGNLATASPLMKAQLDLSSAQMGILFSAFFWSYAPLQPVAGWLAQRYDVRYVLGSGLALWATATALTGCVSSFVALLLLRVLLGIGESVSYPCNAKFLSQHLGVDTRSGANGLIAVGQALGPTCGTLIGGVLMAGYGWRATFVAFGLLSLAWLVPWSRVTRTGVARTRVGDSVPISYRALLSTRSLWGTSLGHFSGNYAYYFTLTWMPLLLVNVHGFTMSQMAFIAAAVYAAQAVSAQASGWACDRWIRGGAQPERVWKRVMTAGLCGVAVAMVTCAVAGATLSITLLVLAGACFGMQSAPLGAITQTLGGSRGAAQWMGVQNLCANLAGVIAPLLTGFIVEATGQFVWAFVLAAAVTLLGAVAYLAIIGRVVPVQWDPSPAGV